MNYFSAREDWDVRSLFLAGGLAAAGVGIVAGTVLSGAFGVLLCVFALWVALR